MQCMLPTTHFRWALKLRRWLWIVSWELTVLVGTKYLHLACFCSYTSIRRVDTIALLKKKLLESMIIWRLGWVKFFASSHWIKVLARTCVRKVVIAIGSPSHVWYPSAHIRVCFFNHWWYACVHICDLWLRGWLAFSKMAWVVR